MRVALLGNYPLNDVETEVHFYSRRSHVMTTWNSNLLSELGKRVGEDEFHFVTLAPCLKTYRVPVGSATLHLLASPPKLPSFDPYTGFRVSRLLLHRYLKRLMPDLVHGIGTDHVFGHAAVTFPSKSVVTVHGIAREMHKIYPANRYIAALAALEEQVILRCDGLIAVTPYVRQVVPEKFDGRIFDIPNAVNEVFFTSNTQPSIDLCFVGGIERNKGLHILLEAISLLSEKGRHYSMKIAGPDKDPGYCEGIRKTVGQLSNVHRIELLRRLTQKETARLIASARLLVLPSLQETAPMVIGEAMACGRPVIATEVGGIGSMITDGVDGILVAPNDPTELARRIEELLEAPDRLSEMGIAAKRKAVARYGAAPIATATISAYRDTLFGCGIQTGNDVDNATEDRNDR